MNSKYKVFKFKSNKFEEIDDLISIEELFLGSSINRDKLSY